MDGYVFADGRRLPVRSNDRDVFGKVNLPGRRVGMYVLGDMVIVINCRQAGRPELSKKERI